MASRIEVRRRTDTERDARAAGVEEDLGKRRARGQSRRAEDARRLRNFSDIDAIIKRASFDRGGSLYGFYH